MKSGIYEIVNLKNGKKYIGQSIDLYRRKIVHFSTLRTGKHDNKYLQNVYNKYGEKIFEFKILLYCEPFELTRYEQFFVDRYERENLYNICLDCVDSTKGVFLSQETKNKISKAMSGKNNVWYGRHHSEETKKKMSKAQSGANNGMYGKTHSKETRKKLAETSSGKNNAMYGMSGKKSPNYGKKHLEETKIKISEAQLGEKNHASKLTKKNVFKILELYYNKKLSRENISKIFPVTKGSIDRIIRGDRWKQCYNKFMETYNE